MSKTVPIRPNPRKKQSGSEVNPFDAFVGVKEVSPLVQPPQRMKRLTFDIPADLHKRIRLACVEKEEDMAAELRRILLLDTLRLQTAKHIEREVRPYPKAS